MKHYLTYLSFWVWVSMSQGLAQAPEPTIKFLSVEDGLSDRTATCIFQDSRGFLWINSALGLNRYDGQSFKFYTRLGHGLSDMQANRIMEDKQDNLWLLLSSFHPTNKPGDINGLIDIFDPIKESSTILSDRYELPFKMSEISDIKADRLRNIWILRRNESLYKFDGDNFLQIWAAPPHQLIRNFVPITEGRLAIHFEKEILIIDTLGKELVRRKLPPFTQKINSGRQGRIWFEQYITGDDTTKPARLSYLNENDEIVPFLLKGPDTIYYKPEWYTGQFSVEDSSGRLWLIQNNKVNVYSPKGEILYENITEKINPNTRVFSQIFIDQNRAVWIASSLGIFRITFPTIKFHNFLETNKLLDTRGISEDDKGNLYIAAKEIFKIDSHGIPHMLPTDYGSVGIMKDREGRLWFGDYNSVLTLYEPHTGIYQNIFHPDYQPDGGSIAARLPFVDHTGKVWIGSMENGLAYVDDSLQQISDFDQYNEFNMLRNSAINGFLETSEGIWLQSSTGLYLLSLNEGIIAHFL